MRPALPTIAHTEKQTTMMMCSLQEQGKIDWSKIDFRFWRFLSNRSEEIWIWDKSDRHNLDIDFFGFFPIFLDIFFFRHDVEFDLTLSVMGGAVDHLAKDRTRLLVISPRRWIWRSEGTNCHGPVQDCWTHSTSSTCNDGKAGARQRSGTVKARAALTLG